MARAVKIGFSVFFGALGIALLICFRTYRIEQIWVYCVEDGPVEWTSAISFALAGVLLGWQAYRTARCKDIPRLHVLICGVLAVGLVVIAMEEISWGQRFFSSNKHWHNHRGEIGLHYIASLQPLLSIDYFAKAMLVLFLLPALASLVPVLAKPLRHSGYPFTSLIVALWFVWMHVVFHYLYRHYGAAWIPNPLTCVQGPIIKQSWNITEIRETVYGLLLFASASCQVITPCQEYGGGMHEGVET